MLIVSFDLGQSKTAVCVFDTKTSTIKGSNMCNVTTLANKGFWIKAVHLPVFFFNALLAGVYAVRMAQDQLGLEFGTWGTAITGGVGSVWRTLIGALIISVVRIGMTFVGVDIFAQQIVFGVVLILAVAVTIDRSKIPIVK